MSKTYRVAVIGRTGRGNYGHDLDTVWLDLPETEIVAVADEDEAGRGQAERMTTLNGALAVSPSTPSSTRSACTRYAALEPGGATSTQREGARDAGLGF